jgi:hypothetical protein
MSSDVKRVILGHLLFALGLLVGTISVAIDYAGDEPFGAFIGSRALIYIGASSCLVLAWAQLGVGTMRRIVRRELPKTMIGVAFLSVVGIWASTWTLSAYVEDMQRLQSIRQSTKTHR